MYVFITNINYPLIIYMVLLNQNLKLLIPAIDPSSLKPNELSAIYLLAYNPKTI